jgi:HK97 family phage portal protein
MNIGPLQIDFFGRKKRQELAARKFLQERYQKTWSELEAILNRESGSRYENLKTNSPEQLGSYRSWVYSCVSLISDRIASLPFGFYNKFTGEELSSKNKGYKVFTKPFVSPNPLMTFRFIKNFCQIQLDLCGMTCIYKAYNALGQVWELWPLNMNDFMKVETDGKLVNPSVKYLFQMGGGKYIDFDISELIVVNYPHPNDPWNGMSPIQSQAYASDIDTYIEVYERDFFKKGARIDMALYTDSQLSQEKADEIKERWLSKYQGRDHEIAVTDEGLKPIPIKYTNRDFEFLQLANWTKEKVLGAYKVPANKLGSTESNRAGSVYSDISFNRESIFPRLNLLDEEFTLGVCSTYDERLCIQHQNPIPRDRQLEVQEAKAYCGIPTLTVNEFREKVHKLPPVENGDVVILPEGYITLDKLKEYVDSKLESMNLAAQEPEEDDSDRDRDGEEPHTNPDGTDDRDDNPTDGRNTVPEVEKDYGKFFSFYYKFLPVWSDAICKYMCKCINEKKDFKKSLNNVLFDCVTGTVEVICGKYGYSISELQKEQWVVEITNKSTDEFDKTLNMAKNENDSIDLESFFVEQYNSNVRLSKIINALLRSSINYAKWVVLAERKEDIVWEVHSNECGHKGRLESMVAVDNEFKIGKTNVRFPGEKLTFGCDCTISNKEN